MPIKTITLLTRKTGTTLEEFKEYYEAVHAPGAIARMPALARAEYRRNFIAEENRAGQPPVDFDVVTEMVFADEAEWAEMRRSLADPAIARWIAEDVERFADPSKLRSFVVDTCSSS
ncbi:MAG: hypothetical protein GC201_16615 [Alphaproteobacteria bacterium]|nr:hypothetical protein [Alphaproteobacteria bacterium]